MQRRLVILLVVCGLIILLTYKMLHLAQVECSLCVPFNGRTQCSRALGPDEAQATEEAHRNACALLAQGVTEAVACGRAPNEQVSCQPKGASSESSEMTR